MARRANGAAIKSIRELAGVSQKSLAERVGVRQATLSQVEAGRYGLHPEKLRRLADVLGVPLDAITNVTAEPEAAATS